MGKYLTYRQCSKDVRRIIDNDTNNARYLKEIHGGKSDVVWVISFSRGGSKNRIGCNQPIATFFFKGSIL